MDSLKSATKSCLQAFVLLSARLQEHVEFQARLEDVLEESGRFRIWAGNLGALASGHGALDWRLRDASVMRTAVLMLLHELRLSLGSSSAAISGDTLPSTVDITNLRDGCDDSISLPSDDGIEEADLTLSSKLDELFESIVETIESLYKVAFRIRNPNKSKMKSSRASRYKEISEGGGDIFEEFALFDQLHIVELLTSLRGGIIKRSSRDDILISRLTKSNTTRRRQFRYWFKHAQKLADEHVETEDDDEVSDEHVKLDDTPQQQLSPLEPPALSTMEKSIHTTTEATSYHPTLDLDNLETQTVISLASTSRDLEGRVAELPPPPRTAGNDRDFVCPYCHAICPSRYGNSRSWRAHILQDLQPYLCTYTDCSEGQQIYGSRQDWLDHESLCHREAWICREHPELDFRTKSSLEQHLGTTHADAVPEHQRADFIDISATTYDDVREECPFCLKDASHIRNMSNHLANHLERFATFSLPRHVDHEKPLDDRGSAAMSPDASMGSWQTGSWQSGSVGFSEQSIAPSISGPDTSSFPVNAQWTPDAVLGWLSRQGFSEAWHKAFQQLNIHGSQFLNLQKTGASSIVLEEVIKAGGGTVNALAEDSESARLCMLVKFIVFQGAAAEGDYMMVRHLVEDGVDVNMNGGKYGNALQIAAQGGHYAAVQELLVHGANINAADGKYGGALQAASAKGFLGVVKLLLDTGADVRAYGGKYGTTLQAASAKGRLKVVEVLLKRGADVGAQGGKYGSALQAAAAKGHYKVVQLLLKSGADVHAQGGKHGNASQAAAQGGHQEVEECLLTAEATIANHSDDHTRPPEQNSGPRSRHRSSAKANITRFSDGFMLELDKRIAWILAGRERMPGYNNALVKRNFSVFLTESKHTTFRKSMDKDGSFEGLLSFFCSIATTELLKSNTLDHNRWNIILYHHVASFVRLVSSTLVANGWSEDRPGLSSRLQGLESNLLDHAKDLANSAHGSRGTADTSIEAEAASSSKIREMVANSFAIALDQVRTDEIEAPPYVAQIGDYTVGWICGTSVEMAAAKAMLDEEHSQYGLEQGRADQNTYRLGRIGDHNVVIACNKDSANKAAASLVVSEMLRMFTSVRFSLMVGVGSGVPSAEDDIRLGDVVVGSSEGTDDSVVQWDGNYLKTRGQFRRVGSLNPPPAILRAALAKMKSFQGMADRIATTTQLILENTTSNSLRRSRFQYQGIENDNLYYPECPKHIERDDSCQSCDEACKAVTRSDRQNSISNIHYGTIASGNMSIENGHTRDYIRGYTDAKCIDTGASGLMNSFPCLVVKGICDYADSRKDARWQPYAALSAAAYAKVLLEFVGTEELEQVSIT